MNAEQSEQLKAAHKGDFKTLFKIYSNDKKFYQTPYFWVPLASAFIFVFLGIVNKVDFFKLLTTSLTSSVFTIIPCLLGFNLGGFILIVGFVSSDLLKTVAKPLVNQNNYSFYQKTLSVLGAAVFIQIITLLLAFLIYLVGLIQIAIINTYGIIVNATATLFVSFSMLYSIGQLLVVVKHVFMFAQTIHFKITVQRINEEEEQAKIKSDLKKIE